MKATSSSFSWLLCLIWLYVQVPGIIFIFPIMVALRSMLAEEEDPQRWFTAVWSYTATLSSPPNFLLLSPLASPATASADSCSQGAAGGGQTGSLCVRPDTMEQAHIISCVHDCREHEYISLT